MHIEPLRICETELIPTSGYRLSRLLPETSQLQSAGLLHPDFELPWRERPKLPYRTLDVVFFLDLILQFFLAYQATDQLGGLYWVDDQRVIIRNYLSSWFIVDAATVFVPFSLDISSAMPSSDLAASAEDLHNQS